MRVTDKHKLSLPNTYPISSHIKRTLLHLVKKQSEPNLAVTAANLNPGKISQSVQTLFPCEPKRPALEQWPQLHVSGSAAHLPSSPAYIPKAPPTQCFYNRHKPFTGCSCASNVFSSCVTSASISFSINVKSTFQAAHQPPFSMELTESCHIKVLCQGRNHNFQEGIPVHFVNLHHITCQIVNVKNMTPDKVAKWLKKQNRCFKCARDHKASDCT